MTDLILLLAIDTSTDQTGIALFDGSCLDALSWSSCREQTVLLLDEIDHQLKRSKVTVADLGAIAVATGPGRFNALRVGMSVAKGLAFSLDLPLIGVSTLAATAHPYRLAGRPIAAVIDAGRGRLSWQVFDAQTAAQWADVRNTSIEEFIAVIREIAPELCVTGEIGSPLAEALATMTQVVTPPLAGRLGRAGSIAELAYRRFSVGDTDDIASLEPVYLHGVRQPARSAGPKSP